MQNSKVISVNVTQLVCMECTTHLSFSFQWKWWWDDSGKQRGLQWQSGRKKNVTNAIVLMAAAVATATERSKAVCIKILRECTFKMRLSTLKSWDTQIKRNRNRAISIEMLISVDMHSKTSRFCLSSFCPYGGYSNAVWRMQTNDDVSHLLCVCLCENSSYKFHFEFYFMNRLMFSATNILILFLLVSSE